MQPLRVERRSRARHYELQKIPFDTVVAVKRDTDKERAVQRTENKKERDFRKSGLDKKYEEFDGEAYVGRTIRKKFEDGLTYEGTVASYDSKARGDPQKGFRWLVRYLDGDKETMSLEELQKFLV